MLPKWLKAIFSSAPSASTASAPNSSRDVADAALTDASAHDIELMYPPVDRGIPCTHVEQMLALQSQLIERLRLHAAQTPENFELFYLGPIRRLAAKINMLPGSMDKEFSGPGGLFRACLEMAFLSFQASDGRIFTGGLGVEQRHKQEPCWRYCCFAAGLLYPVGSLLDRTTVSTAGGGAWPKLTTNLSEWASAQRYFVAIPKASTLILGPSATGAALVPQIIGPENMSWLENGSPDISRALMDIVGTGTSDAQIALDLIRTIWKKVIQREQARMPSNYGRQTMGTHLPPYLVAAIRHAGENGQWRLNSKCLYADATGLYLDWPHGSLAIIDNLKQFPEITFTASSPVLSMMLVDAGVFERNMATDTGLYTICTSDGEVLNAYKFKSPMMVFESWDSRTWDNLPTLFPPVTKTTLKVADPKEAEFLRRQQALDLNDMAPVPDPIQAVPPALPARPVEQEAEPVKLPPATKPRKPKVKPEESSQALQTGPEPARDHDTDDQTDVVPDMDRIDLMTVPPQDYEAADPGAHGDQLGQQSLDLQAPSVPQTKASDKGSAKPAHATKSEGLIKEAADVDFGSMLSAELRKDLKSEQASEMVGKLLHTYRNQQAGDDNFLISEEGLYIAWDHFAKNITRNPIKLIDAMAAAGMIWTDPSTPGLKKHKRKLVKRTVDCLVISRYGCKKMGVPL